MKSKFACLIAAIIVAFAAWFTARQRALHDLRAGNDSLRRQIDLRPSGGSTTPASTNSAAKLSDTDERELLQLRSSITSLREQARDASNRVDLLNKR